MATLEKMIQAVNLVRDDAMSICQVAKICGVSYETIRRWKHMLEGDISGLYGFVAK